MLFYGNCRYCRSQLTSRESTRSSIHASSSSVALPSVRPSVRDFVVRRKRVCAKVWSEIVPKSVWNKCLVIVFIVLKNQNECERLTVFCKRSTKYCIRVHVTFSIERFQNGCVLKDPLSAFVCFFQHDSGIIRSASQLWKVRKSSISIRTSKCMKSRVENYQFPPVRWGVAWLLSTQATYQPSLCDV